MSKSDKDIRSGQLISPYGVGAILDIGDESFAVMDISRWSPNFKRKIELKRLTDRAGRRLIHPPIASDSEFPTYHAKVDRFPRWLFCSSKKCRRMVYWQVSFEDGEVPTCPYCDNKKPLVPMRFVAACEAGHLSEFPWYFWAHSGQEDCQYKEKNMLFFEVEGNSGGLESLWIRCACGAKRNLEGITYKEALTSRKVKCSGKQPWQPREVSQNCEEDLLAVQRGASNLYYPISGSALDIPIDDTILIESQEKVRGHSYYEVALRFCKEKSFSACDSAAKFIAEDVDVPVEEVTKILEDDASETSSESAREWNENELLILLEEWDILSSEQQGDSKGNYCASGYALKAPSGLSQKIWPFTRVNMIDRLREVRAFLGFHRIRPGKWEDRVHPDCGKGKDWVPAVEVFGEGIFIQFDEQLLRSWEDSLPEKTVRSIRELNEVRETQGFWFLPQATPRYIALHTFSHILIRQLAFESGYASSSLRERIYASRDNSMAGVLIYTADSDSEGSLGGLVRMGRPERFVDTVMLSLSRSLWCSADPVCSETKGQGLGGFNRAACHACSLISETSCTSANTLLDRTMLFGRQEEAMQGLFQSMIEEGI